MNELLSNLHPSERLRKMEQGWRAWDQWKRQKEDYLYCHVLDALVANLMLVLKERGYVISTPQ